MQHNPNVLLDRARELAAMLEEGEWPDLAYRTAALHQQVERVRTQIVNGDALDVFARRSPRDRLQPGQEVAVRYFEDLATVDKARAILADLAEKVREAAAADAIPTVRW